MLKHLKIMCKNVAQVLHANTVTAEINLPHFLYNSPNDHGLKFYTRSNRYNLKGKIIFSSGQKIHDVWWSPFVARFQVCASRFIPAFFPVRVRRCFGRARHEKRENRDWMKILLVAFGGNKLIGRLASRDGLVTRKPLR